MHRKHSEGRRSVITSFCQVLKSICSCFDILRQMRYSLPCSSSATLTTAFILSKVHYCNVALSSLPNRDLEQVGYGRSSMLLLGLRLERANIRPCHAVAEGPTLAACTRTHNLQVVRIQLSSQYGATLSYKTSSSLSL